jgi:hypothetical protein
MVMVPKQTIGNKTNHIHLICFFIAIGDYYKSLIGTWRDKEVSAYTFPKYKDALLKFLRICQK